MSEVWRPKPGDQVFHPRRIARYRLRRVLGVPALFSIGYGDVGSSIYYGLGLVAVVALGATPIALGIAGLIYVCNALTYAEGSAMLTEGGGSSSYARLGFNDLIGFISGWALMLSYVATMAISAYTIPPYLAYFWPILKQPMASTLLSMGVIVFLMLVNVFGIRESSRLNITFIIGDIIMQVALVVLGAVLILGPNPHVLYQHMFGSGNWPSAKGLIFGIALAALCFTGVESVSQHGEETKRPEKRMPQAYILMIVVVLVLFAGISLVALTAMTPQVLGDPVNGWARDPVAGIAKAVSQAISPADIIARVGADREMAIIITWVVGWVQKLLPALVAVLAASILLIATNAGLLGISRLTYNLSSHRQLPALLSRVHPRFRTPYIAIGIFSSITLMMLIPGFFSDVFFSDLGALYVFGSLLCFGLAHASILALRVKKPDMPRPFKLGFNIRIGKRELPLTAILGLLATSAIFLVILVIQAASRWTGLGWMALGLIIYFVYRRFR
ncbi:MAG: APC family permease, partial [Dehalococcoidales bacterium]|nr:APC family permease [Dehalococcoidales bacterium]